MRGVGEEGFQSNVFTPPEVFRVEEEEEEEENDGELSVGQRNSKEGVQDNSDGETVPWREVKELGDERKQELGGGRKQELGDERKQELGGESKQELGGESALETSNTPTTGLELHSEDQDVTYGDHDIHRGVISEFESMGSGGGGLRGHRWGGLDSTLSSSWVRNVKGQDAFVKGRGDEEGDPFVKGGGDEELARRGRVKPEAEETRVAVEMLLHLQEELEGVMGQGIVQLTEKLIAAIYSDMAAVKSHPRPQFLKSQYTVSLQCKYTRALTCQNFRPDQLAPDAAAPLFRQAPRDGSVRILSSNLAYQIPYFDLNLRLQLKYDQGQLDLDKASQREARDKAYSSQLCARVRALEEDRKWFDKEVAKFRDVEDQLVRDNQRWFNLYKESSGSMGGVMGEVDQLRRQCDILLADKNILSLQLDERNEENTDVLILEPLKTDAAAAESKREGGSCSSDAQDAAPAGGSAGNG
jgi:hypothetical protein